ncbi:hypothetical protein [Tenacibaculum sp. UWU-22]|uniref:hypothetical protein n=1 Tax=Tenacibaculum sp. UWU-22 TaxID=3234187 RepID=UPI0034DADAAC
MLNTINKIILVDNREDHLNTLSEVFFNENIGCLPIIYESTYDKPLVGVRLAFFDINLLDLGSESQIIATVVDAIPKYISTDNGPYALIFWTDKKTLIPKIKKYINERKIDVPKPIMIDCIDKDVFYDDATELLNKLKQIFADKTLNVLIDFENVVTNAASKTVNQFFEIIPSNDKWGSSKDYVGNFEKIFSSLAESSSGFHSAKANPDKAVYSTLNEALKFHIENSTNTNSWKNILTSLNNAKKPNKISKVARFNYFQLNNLIHIENEISSLNKDDRGVVIELDKSYLKNYGLTFRKFYDAMIKFKKRYKESTKILRLIHSSKLVCIEISASCDHSQRSNRINKYIFGIITRKMKSKDYEHNNNSIPANSVCVLNYLDNKEEKQIWVNYNYVVGLNTSDENLGRILFRLKGEMINQIGNRYANHVSRIGITSFR